MRAYVNETYVERQAKLGRRLSVTGLVILGIGMIASFAPNTIENWIASGNSLAESPAVRWFYNGGWLIVSLLTLVFGFFLSQFGNRRMRIFQRSPRPDQVIERALKGFDDRNTFYAFAGPADMVLAGPAGIFAFVARDSKGKVFINGDNVKQPFSLGRFFSFGQDSAGAPVQEAEQNAAALGKWLQEKTSATEPIEVNPVVVFINDNADLQISDASAPVVHQKQLKNYLRNRTRPERLTKETLQSAIAALDAEATRRGVSAE